MQTLQKSSFSGKSLLFTLISFSELETNTQYSIIEIERDDAERADLGRVGDMKSDAPAKLQIFTIAINAEKRAMNRKKCLFNSHILY